MASRKDNRPSLGAVSLDELSRSARSLSSLDTRSLHEGSDDGCATPTPINARRARRLPPRNKSREQNTAKRLDSSDQSADSQASPATKPGRRRQLPRRSFSQRFERSLNLEDLDLDLENDESQEQ